HLAEMQHYSLCQRAPLFVPSVDHAFCGMVTSTPIPAAHLAGGGVGPEEVWRLWQQRYQGEPFVRVVEPGRAGEVLRDGRFLDLGDCNFTNRVDLFAFGSRERGLVLVGRQDNLGKGASGNAVQCLNLMLGFDETTGLTA
ncbi:MAG: N-acetyl-gamma-glutamyl-phosphate reductase, partial [Gemmatimonadota bacterium]